jgi:hypothetical protein
MGPFGFAQGQEQTKSGFLAHLNGLSAARDLGIRIIAAAVQLNSRLAAFANDVV